MVFDLVVNVWIFDQLNFEQSDGEEVLPLLQIELDRKRVGEREKVLLLFGSKKRNSFRSIDRASERRKCTSQCAEQKPEEITTWERRHFSGTSLSVAF